MIDLLDCKLDLVVCVGGRELEFQDQSIDLVDTESEWHVFLNQMFDDLFGR